LQRHGGHHRPAIGYAASRNQRYGNGIPNHGYQTQGGSLFPSIVATGLKAFGYHGIHTRVLALYRKLHAAHHVHHHNVVLFKVPRPSFGAARRGKHNRHPFLHNDFHNVHNIRVQQGYVYRIWFIAHGGFALLYVLA
jgi:hypothetical protein